MTVEVRLIDQIPFSPTTLLLERPGENEKRVFLSRKTRFDSF